MTPEAQRIAIAEACGWHDGGGVSNWPHYGYRKGAGKPGSPELIPDYINDLNAMHEVVRRLADNQRVIFGAHLRRAWARDYNEKCGLFPSHDDSCNATAAQRAEAFLRTLGKWTSP